MVGIEIARDHGREHPGAQLRFTDADADGMRLTRFATNTTGTPIPHLELRPSGAVETGAHPTRQPGRQSAHAGPDQPKRPAG